MWTAYGLWARYTSTTSNTKLEEHLVERIPLSVATVTLTLL